ncbi:MAG: HAMP domain-containing histidine kinase [Arcobacteraceae bacterium]|nr:HAMP domain-containing histidine kinase [Arcobacteraceae bacterium]
MNTKSIYKQFYQKLIFATSALVIVLSFIFYGFTKATIYEDISNDLLKDARLIYKLSTNYSQNQDIPLQVLTTNDVTIDLVTVQHLDQMAYRKYRIEKNHFIELLYPFDKDQDIFIKITKNINSSHKMLNKIFNNVLFLGLGGLIMIILYAFAVSKTLLSPILNITKKLSNMDENSLTKIDTTKLPIEFNPLANSINTLTTRIENYIKYQKELFIGTAHELKTPLAVMKLKSEVTLRRKREPEKYEEVLKVHIKEIDKMDKMISSILDMGRQEGAQFEKPMEVDIIDFLTVKTDDYKLLANKKYVNLIFETTIDKFITIIQPNLLNQIIQNFVQNAIKFTPENNKIIIRAVNDNHSIKIEVLDEGIGIDENIDLFAPFQRQGKESGAGLGLFLAQSAADTLGATISLQNRQDGVKGTIATLYLDSNPTCQI